MCVKGIEGVGRELFDGFVQIVMSGVNTVAGVGASILTPFGQWDYMNQHTDKAFDAGRVLQIPFRVVTDFLRWDLKEKSWSNFGKQGYFTQHVARSLFEGGVSCARTSSDGAGWINRYFTSRIAFLLYPVVSLVTRIADFIFGVMATFFALVKLGRDPELNKVAENNLSFFAIIGDVCVAVRGIIYPQQTL